MCPSLYKAEKPLWLYQWWDQYGPKVNILPEPYNELYQEWVKVSPALIEANEKNQLIEGMPSFLFFTEFSIPWIWRWVPYMDETSQGIPCMTRLTETKFWKKMLKPDEHGNLEGQSTIDNIQQAIKAYSEIRSYSSYSSEASSPFKQMARRLKIQQGTISSTDMMKAYLKAIKEDLVKNFPKDTDVSMKSATQSEDDTEEPEDTGEDEDCYSQLPDSQPPEDSQEILEKILKFIDQWEQSASSKTPDPTNKGKGPASQ